MQRARRSLVPHPSSLSFFFTLSRERRFPPDAIHFTVAAGARCREGVVHRINRKNTLSFEAKNKSSETDGMAAVCAHEAFVQEFFECPIDKSAHICSPMCAPT